jgi:hypothetical protein
MSRQNWLLVLAVLTIVPSGRALAQGSRSPAPIELRFRQQQWMREVRRQRLC